MKPRILLAMDKLPGEHLSQCLTTAGYETTLWSTVAQPLRIMQAAIQGRCDLLILTNTVCLPAWILEALPSIRTSCPTMKIMVLSGYMTDEFVRGLKNAGVDPILKLPFIAADVLEKVRAVLAPSASETRPAVTPSAPTDTRSD